MYHLVPTHIYTTCTRKTKTHFLDLLFYGFISASGFTTTQTVVVECSNLNASTH